jgi:CPA1 family monovalent cation:H+ antiporter
MHGFEVLLGLLLVVAMVALAAERLRIPYPILLVLAGLGLSVIPGLPRLALHPDYVFLVFLPPLLYYAGSQTTWRDFRANLRPISMLAVGLVLATTVAVAWIAHALIPGMTWPVAFALGAIVSPPDAVAATAITERLHVPRRVVAILEGESLVNDATALVALRFAVAAVLTGTFSLPAASVQFLYVAVGGIAVGYLVGAVAAFLRCKVREPSVEGTISLLTPFVAYLPSEALGVSGVLAAVTAGIYMSRKLPLITSANSRLRNSAVWETLVFLLNGLLFVLIGLQLPSITESLSHIKPQQLLLYAVAVCLTAIVVRVLWVFLATYVPRLIPALRRNDPAPPVRQVALIAWAGMRGVVSLAAALALPTQTNTGEPFPQRDMIIFLAFAVILCTLVLQGLTLPPLIHILHIKDDGAERAEEQQARVEATHAALARLQVFGFDETINPSAIDRIRSRYEQRLASLGARPRDGIDTSNPDEDAVVAQIHREALIAERRMITFLRDQNIIGDSVLRRLMHEVDLEEARLGATAPTVTARDPG